MCGPRILPALQERVSTATAELLTKLGVRLMIGETVAEVAPGMIRTASGKTVRADLTVWAAGIKAPAILSELDGLPVNRLGQLIVRRTLQTEVDDNIFEGEQHAGIDFERQMQIERTAASFLRMQVHLPGLTE